jgi:hypothetical protein
MTLNAPHVALTSSLSLPIPISLAREERATASGGGGTGDFGASTTNFRQSAVFDQDLSLNSAANRASSGRCDRSVRLGPVAPANADGGEP